MIFENILVLRTCANNMADHCGLIWPMVGPVECKFWKPSGLHENVLTGLLWGKGVGAHLSAYADARWVVCEVAVDQPCRLPQPHQPRPPRQLSQPRRRSRPSRRRRPRLPRLPQRILRNRGTTCLRRRPKRASMAAGSQAPTRAGSSQVMAVPKPPVIIAI